MRIFNLIYKIKLIENGNGIIFLKKLLDIEEKANLIFLNIIGFPNSFVDQFQTFKELILNKDNLLAHADFYKVGQPMNDLAIIFYFRINQVNFLTQKNLKKILQNMMAFFLWNQFFL